MEFKPEFIKSIIDLASCGELIGRPAVSKMFNITPSEAQQYISIRDFYIQNKFNVPSFGKLPVEKIDFNNSSCCFDGNSPINESDVFDLFDIDPDLWYVDKQEPGFWDVTNKVGQTFRNYRNRFKLARILPDCDVEGFISSLSERVVMEAPPQFVAKPFESTTGNVLEINIRDLHLGKLCLDTDLSNPYNVAIAYKRAIMIIDDLLVKGHMFGFDRICLVCSDDFLHIDGQNNCTTKGTPQDVDGKWHQIFTVGHQLMCDFIYRCLAFSPVDVMMVYGNHDKQLGYAMGEVLKAWFRNDSDSVNVDNRFIARKYKVYNDILLGFTHGKGNIKSLPSQMNDEASDLTKSGQIREFHIGHYHSKHYFEENGVTVRSMRSLSETDEWHMWSGYTGALKGAEAIVWGPSRFIALFESTV